MTAVSKNAAAPIMLESFLPLGINAFELVVLSAYLAGRLAKGETPSNPEDKNHKFTVAALMDIRRGGKPFVEELRAGIHATHRLQIEEANPAPMPEYEAEVDQFLYTFPTEEVF